jgi:hypothetical protein
MVCVPADDRIPSRILPGRWLSWPAGAIKAVAAGSEPHLAVVHLTPKKGSRSAGRGPRATGRPPGERQGEGESKERGGTTGRRCRPQLVVAQLSTAHLQLLAVGGEGEKERMGPSEVGARSTARELDPAPWAPSRPCRRRSALSRP